MFSSEAKHVWSYLGEQIGIGSNFQAALKSLRANARMLVILQRHETRHPMLHISLNQIEKGSEPDIPTMISI
jgi:hypothetical protein